MPMDDTYEVDTALLREKAERGRAAIAELQEILRNLQDAVTASEAYWTGEAGEFFRERLGQGLKGFASGVEEASVYPRELLSYADEYDGVITQTEMIAESVENLDLGFAGASQG